MFGKREWSGAEQRKKNKKIYRTQNTLFSFITIQKKTMQDSYLFVDMVIKDNMEGAQRVFDAHPVEDRHNLIRVGITKACELGNHAIFTWLWNLHTEIILPEHYGAELFRLACKAGNRALAEDIMAHFPEDISTPQFTIGFVWACGEGHLGVSEWLLHLGADARVENWKGFRWACFKNQVEVTKWLTTLYPIDIHVDDDYGYRWACKHKCFDMITWLLHRDPDGYRTVSRTIRFASQDILQHIEQTHTWLGSHGCRQAWIQVVVHAAAVSGNL